MINTHSKRSILVNGNVISVPRFIVTMIFLRLQWPLLSRWLAIIDVLFRKKRSTIFPEYLVRSLYDIPNDQRHLFLILCISYKIIFPFLKQFYLYITLWLTSNNNVTFDVHQLKGLQQLTALTVNRDQLIITV